MDIVNLQKVQKKMAKLPDHIRFKVVSWAIAVELEGVMEVRKIAGYHDEPLLGKRQGQRSVRLSRSYRLIYIETKNGNINILVVEEVNKHEY